VFDEMPDHVVVRDVCGCFPAKLVGFGFDVDQSLKKMQISERHFGSRAARSRSAFWTVVQTLELRGGRRFKFGHSFRGNPDRQRTVAMNEIGQLEGLPNPLVVHSSAF
jgi:hypothetical protein